MHQHTVALLDIMCFQAGNQCPDQLTELRRGK